MRKVCVVTGSRAEYGLMYWVLRGIADAPELDLQIAATGMHLSPEFGATAGTIEADGFTISERVESLLSSDTAVGVAKSIGLGVIGFADAFARLAPDVVVVLGDRFEVLAAAQAALVAKIPIAHIHGGETTEGAFDEAIRHSVSKMATYHFTATKDFRRRVIQLGESPERVFNVGAPGLDHVLQTEALSREDLEASLGGFSLAAPAFLVTYHPATLASGGVEAPVAALTKALDRFPDAHVLITKSNADTDGRRVNELLQAYADARPDSVKLVDSLGQIRYLSALRHVSAVIGNSSSGITEAPSFGVPTVNIGDRQKGRPRAESVLDCAENADAIEAAIRQALGDEVQARLATVRSPYGGGGASGAIVEHLRTLPLGEGVLARPFYDLPHHP
ncbi:UDP-N-acetylglucosamine 2-epimerase [Rubricoccus marinus]|uniref:UDP-N-acetyl-D-glucosamine 2-epimerase, UDP-hydrolysing n=1 Tax=Rubricoccus marinus TaxID=716817 RepID=A0A259U086_9BACT|nr:UDP-N-acetylglucosamine 2-epimerase [Rubricoccus marinus]OZC03433.1 UDP-N-acetyl-D-glucosamine 2-epimerase, UDP-hydrolysing [Rubricoccus marinus]